jgi:predicted protein tyrosine phosphatase
MLKERGYSVRRLEDEMYADFYVGSAGVIAKQYGNQESRQYTPEMGDISDVIFVADEFVLKIFNKLDSRNLEKVIQLEIPDEYKASDEVDYRKLVNLFEAKLAPYLPEKK